MKYGSLEWAQDLLNSTKSELDKINAADEKGKAAAEGLGLTNYYTGLVKALEDEIAKGNYIAEKEMPAKDTSDDEDIKDFANKRFNNTIEWEDSDKVKLVGSDDAEDGDEIEFGSFTEFPPEDEDEIIEAIMENGENCSVVEREELENGECMPSDGDFLANENRVFDREKWEWIGPLDWLQRRGIDYKKKNVGNIASTIVSNDLGRDFSVTAEDKDSDGDTDKLTIEEEDED